VDAGGRSNGITLVLRDITDRKRAEPGIGHALMWSHRPAIRTVLLDRLAQQIRVAHRNGIR